MRAYVGLTRDRKLRSFLAGHDIGVVLMAEQVAKEVVQPTRKWLRHKPGTPEPELGWNYPAMAQRLAKVLAEWPSWFMDNGAFAAFKAGAAFDTLSWIAAVHFLDTLALSGRDDLLPDFIVLPDVVAEGRPSYEQSEQWLRMMWLDDNAMVGGPPAGTRPLDRIDFAFVVQEGMTPEGFPWELPFQVLFVGGGIRSETDPHGLHWKSTTAPEWIRLAHQHGKRVHVGRVGSQRRVREAAEIGVDSIDSALPLFSWDQARGFVKALEAPVQGRLFNPEEHWYADVR